MSNVVEVVVRQRAEGTALRDAARETEDLRRRSMEAARAANPTTVEGINRLNRAAAVYETNGDTGMARSARADRRVLERDLERDAAERFAHERGITREHRERAAVTTAQESRMLRLGRAGANLAERAAGASPFGGVTSALGGIGGVAGLAAGAIVGIGTAIAAQFAKQSLASDMIGLDAAASRATQNRRLDRAAGFEGTSGGSRQMAESFRDEVVKLNADRPKLERQAQFQWWNPASWKDHITGASGNAMRENDEQRQLALEGERRAAETGRKKFNEIGAVEIEALKKRSSYDMREARELERTVAWRKEFNRLQEEFASPEEAQEGARLKDLESRRAEAAMFGRLVNSRSGAGDIARAAALANGGFSGRHVEKAIEKQTTRMTEHHDQVVGMRANAALKVPALKRPGQQNAEILARYGT